MTRILGASKVTVRYQVTIPEDARRFLHIEDGQTVIFVEENGKVVIKNEL
ncbi:AbrB/MazE/SpoVT family DNA-binding domain-containing protein [Candidatus Nitrosotenuis cloacae]|nr:AbrB/MazE/SpoVT family DNA-binding domain-containing protein [Candidatus Nitrosotenuis cloacae]